MAAAWRAETDGHWAIIHADTRRVVGQVSLRGRDLDTGCAELG